MIEKLKESSTRSRFVIIVIVTLLLTVGWGNVVWQYFAIERAIISSFQQAQLEIVRSAALAAKQYADDQFANGRDISELATIEVEIQTKFVQPIQLINETNTAWIIGSDNRMVFDESVDFVYEGIPINDFLDLQAQRGGANSYEPMRDDVIARREGVGAYIWVADTGWSWDCGFERGWEIGAWAPVDVSADTQWMIGMTTKLTDIRHATGAAKSVHFSALTMLLVTIIVIGFVFYVFNSSRQVVALQKQVIDLQIKIDNVEKARQVDAIVDSDYFKGLRDQAQTLRQQSRRRRSESTTRRRKE